MAGGECPAAPHSLRKRRREHPLYRRLAAGPSSLPPPPSCPPYRALPIMICVENGEAAMDSRGSLFAFWSTPPPSPPSPSPAFSSSANSWEDGSTSPAHGLVRGVGGEEGGAAERREEEGDDLIFGTRAEEGFLGKEKPYRLESETGDFAFLTRSDGEPPQDAGCTLQEWKRCGGRHVSAEEDEREQLKRILEVAQAHKDRLQSHCHVAPPDSLMRADHRLMGQGHARRGPTSRESRRCAIDSGAADGSRGGGPRGRPSPSQCAQRSAPQAKLPHCASSRNGGSPGYVSPSQTTPQQQMHQQQGLPKREVSAPMRARRSLSSSL